MILSNDLKKQLKYVLEICKNIINNQIYTFIISFSIIISIYGSLNGINYNWISSLILSFSNCYYIIGLLILFLINTKIIYDYFKKNYNYIIRFKNKNKYFEFMFVIIIILNLFIILINLILLCTFLNFFGTGKENIIIKCYSNIHILYFIFILTKTYLLSIIFSFINLGLFCTFNKKIVIFLNIIIYWSFYYFIPFTSEPISDIKNIPININYYIISYNVQYSGFIFELLITTIYLIVLLICIKIFYKLISKKFGDF